MAFERLQYLVTLDPTGATAGANKIASSVKKATSEADADIAKLQKRVDSLNAKSIRLGNKGDRLGSDVAAIQSKEASGALAGLTGGGVGGLGGAATSAAVAGGSLAAVGAGLAFVKKSVGDFQSLTEEVRRFQRVTGESAESSSALAFTFKRLGVDSEVGSKALFIFGKNVQNNEAALKAAGVAVARDAKGNVDFAKTLENVSAAYQGTADATQRSAIAGAAFGRGGEALLPVLGKTKAELADIRAIADKQGLLFDQKALEQGRELSLSMKDINSAIKGIEVDTAKAFVPLVQDLADVANAVIPVVHNLGLVDAAVQVAFGPLATAKGVYDKLTGSTKDHAAAAKEDTSATLTDTAALADAATAADDAAKAVEKAATVRAGASQKVLSADQAALSAAEALQSADERVAAATEKVAATADDAAKNAQKVADARLAEADAVRGVADAEKALADIQREAPRNLERAAIARNEANRAQNDAQDEYDKVLRRRGANDDTGKLAAAADRLRGSTLDRLDAEDKIKELQSGKPVQEAIRARDAAIRAQQAAERHTAEVLKVNPYETQQKAVAELDKAEQDRAQKADVLKNKLVGVTGELSHGFDVVYSTTGQLGTLVEGLQAEVDKQTLVNQGLDDQLQKLKDIAAAKGDPLGGAVPGATPAAPLGGTAVGPTGSIGSKTVQHYFGPITVQANDPNAMQKALENKYRLQRLGGAQ